MDDQVFPVETDENCGVERCLRYLSLLWIHNSQEPTIIKKKVQRESFIITTLSSRIMLSVILDKIVFCRKKPSVLDS